MSLAPGTRLGHYQLLSPLGEGGMGTVYKASDTRLDRTVAIKILKGPHTERFEREARAISALNHPNICTLHDIGADQGISFLVMEYVDGKPLAGPLPIDEALRLADQIAAALEAAHRQGITHRDLKPGNILVTRQGVKLLDFGLAKRQQTTGPEVATLAGDTEKGTILGTLQYMAPEQLEGREADPRSDIFAFGLVLYEMISGRRAFEHKTQASLIAAILKEEPRPLLELQPLTPAHVDQVIRRCLMKDPDERWQSARDVAHALRLKPVEAPTLVGRRRFSPWNLAVGVLCGVLAMAAAWWQLGRPRQAPEPKLVRLTGAPGIDQDPALSRDGRMLAYASDRAAPGNLDIWIQQVESTEAIRLTSDPTNESEPSFSSDGTRIAFRSERDGGGIYVVPALGGDMRKLVDRGHAPQFSPDGKWVAYCEISFTNLRYAGSASVYVIPSAGGEPRPIQPKFASAGYPVWSPDGTHLAFVGLADAKDPDSLDLWVTPMDGGEARATGARALVTVRPELPRFRSWAGNRIFFSQASNLWALLLDRSFNAIRTQRITFGSANESSPSVAATPEGLRVAFSSRTSTSDLWSRDMAAPGAGGEWVRLTNDLAVESWPHLSGDGRKLVYDSNRAGNQDIWLRDMDSGKETAITTGPEDERIPRISPDGSYVVFMTGSPNARKNFVLNLNQTQPKLACGDCGSMAFSFSPDNRSIFARLERSNLGVPIGLVDVATGAKTPLLQRPGVQISGGVLSPDSKWIAFSQLEPGVGVTAFVARTGPQRPIPVSEWIQVGKTGGSPVNMVWSPDGTKLYSYTRSTGELFAQPVDSVTKRPMGPALVIARVPPGKILENGQVTFGGNRIVAALEEPHGNIWMATLPE